jgi:DNA-binding MltR family transcriptional regulator
MANAKVHTREQITALLDELKKQTDRGVAIIASAVLEEIVALMILHRLVDLGSERRDAMFAKPGAPLSNFSAKIEMAFALGLIPNQTRLALHLIRDVRNKFAHRIESLTFDDPEVANMIATRIPPTISGTMRERFLAAFQSLSTVFYAIILLEDIRIKPLEQQIHAIEFVKAFFKAFGPEGEQVRSFFSGLTETVKDQR